MDPHASSLARRTRLSAGWLLLLWGACVASAAYPPIDPAEPGSGWRAVQEQVAAVEALRADFLERRYSPLRKRPAMLRGTVRFGAAEGLSLQYDTLSASIIIVDEEGLIRRSGETDRPLSLPEAEEASQMALLQAFRMDFAQLAEVFELAGIADEDGWILQLTPRAEAFGRLERVTIEGEGVIISRISIERAGNHRNEIVMKDPVFGDAARVDGWEPYFRRR